MGLARYGLSEPYARIKIGSQDFSFGAANEMSREQYVLSGDAVYLLPLRYGAALPKGGGDVSGPVGYPVKDFYLTNTISRASPVMQRCSAELLHGETWAEAAE